MSQSAPKESAKCAWTIFAQCVKIRTICMKTQPVISPAKKTRAISQKIQQKQVLPAKVRPIKSPPQF